MEFLKSIGEELHDGVKFNSIFGMANAKMFKKYGVNQKKLDERYGNILDKSDNGIKR